jgi:hypothetical protein
MQKRLPRWLLTASIAIGAGGCMCATPAGAVEQSSGDACKLLTAAQVSTVLGVQADEGAYTFPGLTQYCIWREHGKPQMSAQNVKVHLITERPYWAYEKEIGYSLLVKKGSTYFRVESRPIPEGVTRKSDTPADKAKWEEKAKTVEKSIAKEVLKRL